MILPQNKVDDINVSGIIDEYLTDDLRPKRIGAYFPSEIGMCIRRSYYSYNIPKPAEPAALRIFALGNNVHEFLTKALKASKEFERVEEEKQIKIEYVDNEASFSVYGRIDDFVVTKSGKVVILEAKSTGDINKVATPDPKHVMQLTLYLAAQKADYGMLVYADKKNLDIKQFRVDYDETVYKKILNRFKDLDYHLKNKRLPPAEYYIDDKTVWQCKYCPYYKECMQAIADGE